MRHFRILTIALAVWLGACSEHVAPTDGNDATIAVEDNRFTPQRQTVPAGTPVNWEWRGSNLHNVTFDDGPASITQRQGRFERVFATAGTYPYHCTIHGLAMSGIVDVTGQ